MKIKIKIMAIIVLMIGSMASSDAAVVYFDTSDPFVMPSETISVSIFSTALTDNIRMDRISDDADGDASNLYLNPDYDTPLNPGVIVNTGGILIEGVSTGIGPRFPAISGILYSFDYTVSSTAINGQIINIFADNSGGAINQVFLLQDQHFQYVTPDGLSLTVVPEPATITLLGIGGFVLLRRKRKHI